MTEFLKVTGTFLLLCFITPTEPGLLDGIASNLGNNDWNQPINNPLQPLLNGKSNLLNLASLSPNNNVNNRFGNQYQRPNMGPMNFNTNNKEQLLAESQNLMERLQELNRQKQMNNDDNNNNPINNDNIMNNQAPINGNTGSPNKNAILADGQKLLERLQELNRIKEQQQNANNLGLNNPIKTVTNPKEKDAANEQGKTDKHGFKVLSSKKILFQMQPIVPEGEKTTDQQTVYYLDAD